MALDRDRREQYTKAVEERFPDRLDLPGFNKASSLRYGQNPGAPAAFYAEERASGSNMSSFEVLQAGTKGLSFINLADMDVGQRVIGTLYGSGRTNACCIVKHEMPAAVALGDDSYHAFLKAWESDPLSVFGGVHVFSGEVHEGLANLLIESGRNAEVVYAPFFSDPALEVLARRKSLRVVQMEHPKNIGIDNGIEYRRVAGGMLAEERVATRVPFMKELDCVSEAQPDDEDISAAVFNWIVVGYVRSNAVVVGSADKVHGIGSGQRSRIAAAEQAIEFAQGFKGRYEGYGCEGTFMASDGFFPLPDVVEAAAEAGVRGIIYPLGSLRDQEVIDAANERGLIMLVTREKGATDSERAFLHR